ncbi:MAG: FAD-dependent oxidoreductase [Anaerolineales bacterium]|nr:FAD-dependent oxidoreductase [Anaerolineales bacterium]
MSTRRYTQDAPITGEAEVIVVGGGPAGIAAAIAAARNGASTLLLDRYGFLGGMATAGLVGPFMTCYDIEGNEPIIEGVFKELVDRLVRMGAAIDPAGVKGSGPFGGFHVYGHEHVTPFDPEALKIVAQEMVLEAGGELKLHTLFVDSLVDHGHITGIVVAGKAGLEVLQGQILIDATGDGDVAARAGAPFEKGRKDGMMQPASLFFRVGNVDDAAVQAYVDSHPDDMDMRRIVERAKSEGFSHTKDHLTLFRTPRPGEWWINVSRIHHVDATNPQDMTRAEIEGRRQVVYLMEFLREWAPGFSDSYLLDTGSQVGVRETRHILGDYVLTADDVFSARRFEDAIARVSFPIDIHDVQSGGGFFQGPREGPYYTIPYRSLAPRTIENLLLAGRCISASHEAHGSLRVMPPCFAMGQAAGSAAALAIETNVSPRHVDVQLLRQTLEDQGALV